MILLLENKLICLSLCAVGVILLVFYLAYLAYTEEGDSLEYYKIKGYLESKSISHFSIGSRILVENLPKESFRGIEKLIRMGDERRGWSIEGDLERGRASHILFDFKNKIVIIFKKGAK